MGNDVDSMYDSGLGTDEYSSEDGKYSIFVNNEIACNEHNSMKY